VFLRRACAGLRVDFDYYSRYLDSEQSAQHARETILATAGVRPGNGQDLATAAVSSGGELAGVMDHWPRTKTGYRMTKTDVPRLAARWPVAAAFAEQKTVAKIMNDYLGKINTLADDDGRIHPVTNLLLAAHGRASMGSPPIHQFPEGARGMIVPDAGDSFVSIDWSQIEPVTAANLAGDLVALEPYEQRGEKFYTGVAAAAGISYKAAKIVLLAQLYGEGLDKLATDLTLQTGELTTVQDARDLKVSIFRAMPKIKQWLNQVRSIGERYRKVPTLSGRIVDVPMGSWQGEVGVQTHKAINYIVSGSAYDLLAETVVRCEDAGLGDAIYFTMHDEVVASESAGHDIQQIMATPPDRMIEICKRVPVLRTDLAVMGDRWKVV
jgi:DNA polymerase-1